MKLKIDDLKSRVVLNSRGTLTIETQVRVGDSIGSFLSPEGEDRNLFEAPFLPKGGVSEAIRIISSELRPRLIGLEFSEQREVDEALREVDGTENYSRIGSAASLSTSVAVAEAASKSLGQPLYKWLLKKRELRIPTPIVNVVGCCTVRGRSVDVREFLAYPIEPRSVKESIFSLVELHKRVGELLARRDTFFLGGRNDEGAWVSSLPEVEVLRLIEEAAYQVRRETGVRFGLGVDFAGSKLWNPKTKLYVYERAGSFKTREEQIEYVLGLIKEFNLKYVEDPLNDQDFEGFKEITRRSRGVIVSGDDLYVTNISRLMLGTREGAGNCVVIKPNQAGDLTGSEEAAKLASGKKFKIVVSQGRGESPTHHLTHIAIGFSADFIKIGAVGGERVSKLNELIRVEEDLIEGAS